MGVIKKQLIMIITDKYNIGETVILKLETLSYEQLSKVLNLESFEFEINAMQGSQIILNKFGKISLSQIKKQNGYKHIYRSKVFPWQSLSLNSFWRFVNYVKRLW